MLQKTYHWILKESQKPYANWVLGIVSFLESSISPFPPDPLMIPMILSAPQKAWRLAFLTTVTSVLGGALGYAIGYFLFETIGDWIVTTYGLEQAFIKLKDLFNRWGFWIILLKGLTPIPFKIVTITSGVTGLDFMTFMAASVLSRGLRFYIEAILLWKYGNKVRKHLEGNLMLFTVLGVSALILGFAVLKFIT
ncbi:MAG: cytochrome B [Alphaproteobacteria bacterium 16-39-46]|nr:MAG: cytochrome B [Alphaproteobacteria bacterium 16-39-46]OZA42869.1 MAG: cytochrome B [Alphaproteobacteria bacterium 17-39-52]HQS84257.1 YqaA family protein [Alphaproteobacteria bacterium]HQS94091.1 YqaA family protein [Alphaproteobacteria bacterium]